MRSATRVGPAWLKAHARTVNGKTVIEVGAKKRRSRAPPCVLTRSAPGAGPHRRSGAGETMAPSQRRRHMQEDHPVRFSVDYPDRDLNRLRRSSGSSPSSRSRSCWATSAATRAVAATARAMTLDDRHRRHGAAVPPPLLMILFRQKYPRWWFDWNLELLRFTNRVGTYFALMNDRYPSTDEHQWVRLDFPYPDARATSTAGCRWSSGCWRSRTTSCCSSCTSPRSSW